MLRLENKVVVITGAGNGIGRGTAMLFAKEGAKVVVADVNLEAAEKVSDEIYDYGQSLPIGSGFGDVLAVPVDVTDRGSIVAMVQTVLNEWGRIDVLINNAGIVSDKTLLKMKQEQWDKVIAVNLTGVFNCTSIVAKIMAEQGKGVIINASSVVADGNIGQTNYAATKAAVKSMARTWARELGPKGIRVNCVAPGYTNTDMMKSVPADILEKLRQSVPLKRLGEVEDIAEAYLWLASDKSSYVNGTTIHVDGGLSI